MSETEQLSNEEKEQLRQWAVAQGFERNSGCGSWYIGDLRQYYEENPEVLEKNIQFFKEEKMINAVKVLGAATTSVPEPFKTLDENYKRLNERS